MQNEDEEEAADICITNGRAWKINYCFIGGKQKDNLTRQQEAECDASFKEGGKLGGGGGNKVATKATATATK